MDYTELLFAAAALELAGKLKTQASQTKFKDWESYDPDTLKQNRERWNSENPTITFVPAAVARLKEIAAIIRSQP